jgi:putative heme-binding domain-containing protein
MEMISVKKIQLLVIFVCLFNFANPVSASENLLQDGEILYRDYCSHCHGGTGDGDGYNAENLDKEPAELSDLKFISKKTNSQIFRVIDGGGRGVKKSHLMPAFGKTLSQKEIWSLVSWVRHLAKDDTHPVELPANTSSKKPSQILVGPADIEYFRRWFVTEGKSKKAKEYGELLFQRQKSCVACHQIDEEGGKVGPNLSRSAFNYSPEWIYAWIKNPQTFRADSKMPNFNLDDNQAWALVAYLSGLDEKNEGLPEEWSAFLKIEGDPEAGKALFFDLNGKATCSKCHTVKGLGGDVGPNLSHIGTSRSREFLLESLLKPEAVITSGYASVMILTKDKKFITGIMKNESAGGIDLVNKDGDRIHVPREQIKKSKTQKISMMPGNFKDILSPQEIADCLAFLKTLTASQITFPPAINSAKK